MPIFSLIIINYKTPELTMACLSSVFANLSGDFEVIVIDNGSQDGSVEKFNQLFGQRIRVIASETNLGFGLANNLAAKSATGQYLFFLNSDTIIKENILPVLAEALADPRVAVVAPQLILADGQLQARAFGRFPDFFNTFLGKFLPSSPADKAQWVSGAALAIRKDVFDRIGGFDEKYFMYFEDIDLCWAAVKAGYGVKVVAAARVVHLGGKSLADDVKRKDFYYQSQDYFFAKHYGAAALALLKLARLPYRFFKKY